MYKDCITALTLYSGTRTVHIGTNIAREEKLMAIKMVSTIGDRDSRRIQRNRLNEYLTVVIIWYRARKRKIA